MPKKESFEGSQPIPPEEIQRAEEMIGDEARKVQETERSAQILQSVQEAETLAYDTEFSQQYDDLEEYRPDELREELFPFLRGKDLVDLGCGMDRNSGWCPPSVLNMAAKAGARRYVGVEKYGDPYISDEEQYQAKGLLTEIHGDTDMLEFLASLDENSANITINGIDDEVINPKIPANQQYLELLAEHIARVIGRDNIAFGIGSNVIFDCLQRKGLSRQKILERIDLFRAMSEEGSETDKFDKMAAMKTTETQENLKS